MSDKIKEISVAEFFEKNRHLLGYENPTKALLTVVKEGLENSLDACEEAGILPEILISVKPTGADRFKIAIEDNGPGIVESKVPLAFAKFLVGSKFHRLRQSRGIQGIGIHGAVLYSQLTTGKPVKVAASTGKETSVFELMIDVTRNEPKIISHSSQKNPSKWHGIKIELEPEGKYIERHQSILEYLKQTAIANPFARIVFDGPNGKTEFKRTVEQLPKQPREIKPHPHGIELGILGRMLFNTKAKSTVIFLTKEFSRVGRRSAEQICKLAKIEFGRKPQQLTHEESDRLHKAMQMVKLIAPPTDCLSPLGENLITEGLRKELAAEYFVAISRPPTVYRGYPFQIEVGLAYGGSLPTNETSQLFRFANKVPLLYHQANCAINEAVAEVDWRRYGLQQSSGALPVGPLAVLVHFASVWVPFTSEGKQAIATYPEIIKEIKLALQDAGRKLAKFVSQRRRARESLLRKELFEKYIPELAESLEKLTDKQKQKIIEELEKIIKKGGLVGKTEDGSQEKP
jgi:DNA topoisomerase-6 subunit B